MNPIKSQFQLPKFEDHRLAEREINLRASNWVFLLIALAALAAIPAAREIPSILVGGGLLAVITMAISLYALGRGSQAVSAWVLMAGATLLFGTGLYFDGGVSSRILGFYAVFYLFALQGIMRSLAWAILALDLLLLAAAVVLQRLNVFPVPPSSIWWIDAMTTAGFFVLIGLITYQIYRQKQTQQERADAFSAALNKSGEEREALVLSLQNEAAGLKQALLFGTDLRLDSDLDLLPTRITQLLAERFGFEYVAVFLVDPSSRWAELKASLGQQGSSESEHTERFLIGGQSLVGAALAFQQPQSSKTRAATSGVIQSPTDPVLVDEIALPLIDGKDVIGALVIHLKPGNSFFESGVTILPELAKQIAAVFGNARKALAREENLDELSRFHRSATQENWQLLTRTEIEALLYQDQKVQPVDNLEIADAEKAIREKQPVITPIDDGSRLTVPLMLRGEPVGTFSLEIARKEWSDDHLAIIDSVSAQTALAIENAQLIAASQKRAAREREISQGTSKIRETLDLESILQTAASEMRKALNLAEVQIQLGEDHQPDTEFPDKAAQGQDPSEGSGPKKHNPEMVELPKQ